MRTRILLARLITLAFAIALALAYYHAMPLSLGPRVVLQPWLMRQGYLLYEHIADEHPPLIYLLLSAAQSLTSDSLVTAKLALVSLIGMTVLLAFRAGERTGGWVAGIGSALFFGAWSAVFEFGKLWHETFLAPVYTLLLILWRPPSSRGPGKRSTIVTGLLLGLALLIKQHAAAVVLGLLLWNAYAGWRTRRPVRRVISDTLTIAVAASLPVIAFTIYHLLEAGTVENLTFWTIGFSFVNDYRQFASHSPQITEILRFMPAYLLLPPFLADLWHSRTRTKENAVVSRDGWALVLLVSSSLTAYPRFAPFHLQASLPILAWISGTTLARILQRPNRGENGLRPLAAGMAFALILLWTVQTGIPYCTFLGDDQPQTIGEYSNLVALAREVRQHIGPTDCIYVLPDDEAIANLYYLTRCRPPKFWIPTSYPWFTLDDLKPKAIRALQQAAPEWVIYFPGRWEIEDHGQEIVTAVQSQYQLETELSWAGGEVQLLRRRSD